MTMANKKELPTFDFKKITKEEIHAFMVANATSEEKKAFMAVAFGTKPQTVMEPEMVLNAEGKLTQRLVRRKQADGSYKMIPKMKAVPVKGGEAKESYSHRKAVNWFYDTYCVGPEAKAIMTNRPEKKAKTETVKAKDLFADF